MTKCTWCRYEYDSTSLIAVTQQGKEIFSRLCPGCYFCWKHGAPQAQLEQPFTQERRALERFTEEFFSPIPQRFYNTPGVA